MIQRSRTQSIAPTISQPFLQLLLFPVQLLESFITHPLNSFYLRNKKQSAILIPLYRLGSLFVWEDIQRVRQSNQIYNLSRMMKDTLIVMLLVGLAVANYDVQWNCGACSTSDLGTNCFLIKGGPFDNYEFSIDSDYNSCQDTGLFFPVYFTFSCKDKCLGCGIDVTIGDLFVGACTEDETGTNAVTSLNLFYAKYTSTPGATYNWCGSVSCGTSQATITIIAVSAIVVVGLIVGTILHVKRRSRSQIVETEYAVLEK